MIPLKDNVLTRHRFAFITFILILLNVVVFLFEYSQILQGSDSFMQYALTANDIHPLNLITYQFLHGGWVHLIGNMVYLWVFGNNVEDRLGHIPFLLFYLASGIIGGLTQAFLLHSDAPLIGASASIAGILGAYLLWFPQAQIKVLVIIIFYWTVITLPAMIVLGLWFITNLFNSFASIVSADVQNVAYLAHIGGFVLGIIVALLRPIKPDEAPHYSVT